MGQGDPARPELIFAALYIANQFGEIRVPGLWQAYNGLLISRFLFMYLQPSGNWRNPLESGTLRDGD